ncbi:hypothetical protein MBLNU457_5671t1 [Dothideomycetes sp. NU457]
MPTTDIYSRGGFSSLFRVFIDVAGYMPHDLYLFSFRTILSQPASVSQALVYTLTRPRADDAAWYKETIHEDGLFRAHLLQDPDVEEADATILYAHGGAFIGGSADMYTEFYRELVTTYKKENGKNLAIFTVDYTLADLTTGIDPITQTNEVLAAYTYLRKDRGANHPIFIGGDSAGAYLAVNTAIQLSANHRDLPFQAGLILCSPWLELSKSSWLRPGTSWDAQETQSDIVTEAYLDQSLAAIGPVDQFKLDTTKFKKLGRAFITVGNEERLKDQICALGTEFETKDEREVHTLRGGVHNWLVKKELARPEVQNERTEHVVGLAKWMAEAVEELQFDDHGAD